MEQLLNLLHSIRSDIDFEKETALIDNGLIQSLEVLKIFVEIEKEFGIKLPVSKIKPEYFNNAVSICRRLPELCAKSIRHC